MRELMGYVVTLAFALLLSLLVAGPVQLQIAVAFNADLEFVLAILILLLVSLVAIAALAIALLNGVPAIDRTALGLASFIVCVTLALGVWTFAFARNVDRMRDLGLLVEIAVPALLAILIQWWLVRRRRLREMKG